MNQIPVDITSAEDRTARALERISYTLDNIADNLERIADALDITPELEDLLKKELGENNG